MSTNLPLINYDFALKQLGGNDQLLNKLLGQFVSEYREASQEVINFINSNDLKSTELKVHTVKGISGNLGLQALYDCTCKFDAELKLGKPSEALISKFTDLLSQTCSEVEKHV
jgi:HPt (histidine-containing phosphotransfer) domain-containing protein